MAALKELVILLERHKSEELEIWKSNNRKSNQGLLYQYYLKHPKVSDKEACDYVYGKVADSGKFRKLKSDLRDNLENLALFMKIKPKMNKDASSEKALLNKEFAIFHNLMIAGGNLSSIEKGERLLERAIKVGHTLIAKIVAQGLLSRTGIKQNNEKYNHYLVQVDNLGKILVLEEKGLVTYSVIQSWAINTKASLKHKIGEIEEKLESYKNERKGYSSPTIEYFGTMFELYLYSAANNHTKVLEQAQKGVAYFNELPFFYKDYIKSFHFYLIVGHGYRKEYAEAASYGALNLEWIEEGTPSWLKTLELLTYAALRSTAYEAAVKHYLHATKHELYESNSTPMMRDMFKVYFAQISLMQEGGRYVPSKEYADLFKNKFRLGNFKNDLEITEKDKSGLNVSVLFVDIAFELIRGNADQISERFEAIQKYLQRYAEEEGSGRVYSYAKLLELGIKYEWRVKKLKGEEFEPPLHHLQTTQVDILNMRFEIEVLPYEEIWEFLLERI